MDDEERKAMTLRITGMLWEVAREAIEAFNADDLIEREYAMPPSWEDLSLVDQATFLKLTGATVPNMMTLAQQVNDMRIARSN